MRLGSPFFLLLLAPAFVLFILYLRGRIGREATLKFSSLKLVERTGARRLTFTRFWPALLRFVVMIFVIVSLARPQSSSGEQKSTEHVVDIMLVMDVSGSMATLDFHPENRLTAAKQEAKRFLEDRTHDRIGLVIFSGQSFTQCPLTIDHKAVFLLLDRIRLGMMEDGTAIGLGLGTAVNRLKESEAKSKVAVLLTDGVNNAGEIDPLTAADLAKQFGIRVYTVGIGVEGESILPIQDPRFGTRYVKVETEIDEKTLFEIARRTGGVYYRARDTEGLKQIFKAIDELEKTEITVEQYTHYEEKYFLFLWPAFALLFVDVLFHNLISRKLP